MQFFKLVIFSIFIITIDACAQTNTITSPTTTTAVPKRKRRSGEENTAVVIKAIFDTKNRTKLYELEKLFLDKLYSSNKDISSNIDESARFTNVKDGKFITTLTILESSAYCTKIVPTIKNIVMENVFVRDVTIKCGDNEVIFVSNKQ